jgi:outer membrane receptor for ferrienterochelin and colicin
MENSLKDIRFVERSTVEAGKKSGVTFSVGSDFKESPSLIFVDGAKKTKKEMDALSPDQIKSVEILKGESAIKAYGPDAKDGVIKITTKKKVNL